MSYQECRIRTFFFRRTFFGSRVLGGHRGIHLLSESRRSGAVKPVRLAGKVTSVRTAAKHREAWQTWQR